jgi:transcription initiation factor IIE alpha subunit
MSDLMKEKDVVESEMSHSVYCSWCNKHQFMVDRQTLDEFRFIIFKCPDCGKQTTVATNKEAPLLILPGTPTASESKKDKAGEEASS